MVQPGSQKMDNGLRNAFLVGSFEKHKQTVRALQKRGEVTKMFNNWAREQGRLEAFGLARLDAGELAQRFRG